ncbi:hypothetical protein D1159_10140 [Pseudoflavonifractor sp. 524-17]|uniref:hypothetical protein n=1 Tax=Pseudoflavonifractor sp. 524-17 TaxID=2304577 RepID=UPI00137B6134|nr:hypothetical protein [Pseudoflavonifractor sp. 524-17]NCE64935.1 hypothetical protein [Pseudoflavonifractor sp. 524-17]
MEKRSTGKRLLRETDYALLKRVLYGNFSLICLDVDDLTVLRDGETAFLWECPPCASMDELISMALLVAAEMDPERGRKIVSVVLYVNVPRDMSLESLDEICRAIQWPIPKDADIRFGRGFHKEARFLLATSEGRAKKRRKT